MTFQSVCSLECTPQRYFERVPFSLLDDLSVYDAEEASEAAGKIIKGFFYSLSKKNGVLLTFFVSNK